MAEVGCEALVCLTPRVKSRECEAHRCGGLEKSETCLQGRCLHDGIERQWPHWSTSSDKCTMVTEDVYFRRSWEKGTGQFLFYLCNSSINLKCIYFPKCGGKRKKCCLKNYCLALVRLFSWLESFPVHQKVVGSIPGQGMYLG